MNLIERNKSIITEKENLEPLYQYKNFPVFFGCVDTDPKEDIRVDMNWAICPESGIIQLTELVPPDLLYQAQHMDGTGSTWQTFYQVFADYVTAHKPKNVLEIGGGQGAIAEKFIEKNQDSHWTIIEPNPLHAGNDHISIMKGFFDKNFKSEDSYDMVVFSHTWEHAYDPREFIESIASYLKEGDKLVFAYPNLTLWMANKNLSSLNFEHTMLLTDYFVDYLLAEYGFRIIDKHAYKDHSFFYTTEKTATPQKAVQLESKYTEYKKLFMDFVEYYKDFIALLNSQMDSLDEVYVFGGHIFSQYLFEVGLDKTKVVGILDNSPIKEGKRLYGTPFRVFNPEVIRDKKNIGVVLKVGAYREEILQQLLTINHDVTILE